MPSYVHSATAARSASPCRFCAPRLGPIGKLEPGRACHLLLSVHEESRGGGDNNDADDEAVGNAAPPSLPSPPQSSLPGWSTESDLIHRLRSTPNVHVPNIARPPADGMLMSAALSHS